METLTKLTESLRTLVAPLTGTFRKLGVHTLFWGPYNKDPTTKGTILGSPNFGKPPIYALEEPLCTDLHPIALLFDATHWAAAFRAQAVNRQPLGLGQGLGLAVHDPASGVKV